MGCTVATLRTASSSQLRRYSPAVAKRSIKKAKAEGGPLMLPRSLPVGAFPKTPKRTGIRFSPYRTA